MGLFSERRKSLLPEAYTGVNRPPTENDMPDKNALAAATTIGKLFAEKSEEQKAVVNPPPRKVSLSRSSSLRSTSRFVQSPVPQRKKRISRNNSIQGSLADFETSLPLNSINRRNSFQVPKRSTSDMALSNTRQNEILTKPKMIKKTVPTPYGLKTIEVPADSVTPSASRTSSLLGNRRYVKKHSSFTVNSINEKHKLQKKYGNHSLEDFHAGSGHHQYLAPPQTPQSKQRKRVSFTEDSPDNSVLGSSIVEVPGQEEASEVHYSSPLANQVHSSPKVDPEPIKMENEVTPQTPAETPVKVPEENEVTEHHAEIPVKISAPGSEIPVKIAAPESEISAVPKADAQPIETPALQESIKSEIAPVEKEQKVSAPVLDKEHENGIASKNSSISDTPETSVSPQISEKKSTPHPKPTPKTVPITSSTTPTSTTSHKRTTKPQQNHVPSRNPTRLKSKRNSVPAQIPLAHALEKSDTLTAYKHGGQTNRHSYQPPKSGPPNHITTLRSNGAPVKRSSSVMGSRSFRQQPQEQPPRSQSQLGTRTSLRTPKPEPTNHVKALSVAPQIVHDLETKSSFEKIRHGGNNSAFKRLSMRDVPSSPPADQHVEATSPQSTSNSVKPFGIFKSRFDDSDEEEGFDAKSSSAGHKFGRHSMRQSKFLGKVPETPAEVPLEKKKYGFARHQAPGTPPVKKSAIPDLKTSTKYEEPEALKTPSSSINSDKLFEKHLKESKKNFLFTQFDNRKKKKHPELDQYPVETVPEAPKKKKLGGRLKKLFGGKS